MVVSINHFRDRLWSNFFISATKSFAVSGGPRRADHGDKTVADIHHRVLLQVEGVFYHMEMASQRSQNHSWIGRESERRAQNEQGKNALQIVNRASAIRT